jgi:tRNA modification GTPase
MSPDDTIVALSTAPGRAALAVVRLSGPQALAIAGAVVRPWPIEPRTVRRCAALDPGGAVVDRPVVTVYAAPRSYTGEDVVELVTHGGLAAPASVMASLVAAGARPAAPGEFTRRAVLNGKLDLAQAEAVGDLIDAGSSAMQRAALTQLDGGLSGRIRALRSAVLEVEALIAYDIDFPEEDDGPVARDRVTASAAAASGQIHALLATAPAGELVRAGAVVVIAGVPNAGKSSLFNALLGCARALVSEVPGTTRDTIEAIAEPTGAPFPLRLVDTAGLRETADVVERLGVEASGRALAGAHAVLACGETQDAVAAAVQQIRAFTRAPVVGVWTKRDVGPTGVVRSTHDPADAPAPDTPAPDAPAGGSAAGAYLVVGVSAISGTGLHALLSEVVAAVAARWNVPAPDMPIVTRARHRAALSRAAGELAEFQSVWRARSLPAIVAAVHLRAAVEALEEIIGVVSADDVLERVFSEFCVGK